MPQGPSAGSSQDETENRLNRDEDQKPGAPPRTAAEPRGAEGSDQSDKLMTDPATGEWKGPPEPNQSGHERRQ